MKFIFAIFLFLLLMTSVAIAQPPMFPGPPPQAPIDGGLLMLAVGGGAYALNKLRKKN
jgi:hypothetical protein